MKIGAVTVTYENRLEFLSKLIERLNSIHIEKICVVVNGSPKYLFEEFIKYKNINFIFNTRNFGSSTGFKQGIENLKSDPTLDFIWLLDDDNLPKEDALQKIIAFINKTNYNYSKDALLSFRPDRSIFLKALDSNNGSIMLKGKNSALGFSIFGNNTQYTNYQDKGLRVAPYGGLFFHKSLIDTIGYPNESFFLYGDDYDFTIRIPENDGKIMLVKDSIVTDLETSFHLKKKSFFSTRFHKTKSLDKIFYAVRNGIIFELKHLVDNKAIYYFNLSVYSMLISITLLFYPKKLKTYFRAVNKGIRTYKNG